MTPKVQGTKSHEGPEVIGRGVLIHLDQLSVAESSGHRVPTEGLTFLIVAGLRFRGLGFRVWGFRGLGV